MLARVLTEGAFSALSMLFGGLGIFFLYLSTEDPVLAAYAVIFLGCASTIVLTRQQRERNRRR
jgi:putative Mn2+ efflux pump MntP